MEITQKLKIRRSGNAGTARRRAFFWIVAVVITLFCVHLYRVHSAKVAIAGVMRRDTMLMEDMLSALASGSVNYADLFEKVAENTKSRETVIRDMEMLNPYVCGTEIDDLIGLLRLENEFAWALKRALYTEVEMRALKETTDNDEDEAWEVYKRFTNAGGWEKEYYRSSLRIAMSSVEQATKELNKAKEEHDRSCDALLDAVRSLQSARSECHAFLPESSTVNSGLELLGIFYGEGGEGRRTGK